MQPTQQQKKHIDELFNNLPIESFVCHWHKMDIIEHYCDWLLNLYPIRQDFAYDFQVENHKCQIEDCECDAEIRLIKKETYNGAKCG